MAALPGAVPPESEQTAHWEQPEDPQKADPDEDTDDGSTGSDASTEEEAVQGPTEEVQPKRYLHLNAEVQAWSPTSKEDEKRRAVEEKRNKHLDKVKEGRRIKSRRLTAADAQAVLKEVKFFSDFEQVMPGVTQELAKLCLMQVAAEGEVLFRQGDPPQDCYVIMQGAVGVYQRQGNQLSPRKLVEEEFEVLQELETRRRCCFCFSRKKADETVQTVNVDANRRYVTEGHNTYTSESKLGNLLVELGKHSAFGELGLMEDKPRAASIRCQETCTFLVIQKDDFQRLFAGCISASAYQKKLYFHQHVPGFDKEKGLRIRIDKGQRGDQKKGPPSRTISRQAHAADRFEKEEGSKGHSLMEEHNVAPQMIVVICSGEIEFTRSCQENVLGLKRRVGPATATFARLTAGQIFCSLATLGYPGVPEQFSARVSSDACTYYVARAEAVRKIPERILSQIREHVIAAMRPLLCYSGAFMALEHADVGHIPSRRPPSARNDRQISLPQSPAYYPQRGPRSAKI
eukprot:gb/GFBE01008498.1/.p1 GENE.gb/GFBE01008498.1/~~gb/GFBE01008498.1/.p1  ORF type:complete len:516 (+),score=83.77 gb/GFBE01008498.1/:1-1548(+)